MVPFKEPGSCWHFGGNDLLSIILYKYYEEERFGTDITEAFEAHHINPATEKLLNKYYVRDANTPRNSPFTFKEDCFYRTLKRAVYEELKKIPKDVSKTADRITDGLFISLLMISVLACWTENYFATNFWYFLASVSLALLTVAYHNFIHRRTNWRMYLFNMSMWSYSDFRVSHAISHHLYTNTLMDLELSSLEPFLIFNPRRDKPLHAKLGFITELFLFPFIFLLSFTKRSETPDWGIHQVEALLDRRDVNSSAFAMMTLFGEHTLHHMFPTFDHCVLKYLQPIFLEDCVKYQANYRVSTQFELVIGQIRENMRTEFKTLNKRPMSKRNKICRLLNY